MATVWFVSYKIPVLSGDQLLVAGPYKTANEAHIQCEDIIGFEGVVATRIYSEDAEAILDAALTNSESNART